MEKICFKIVFIAVLIFLNWGNVQTLRAQSSGKKAQKTQSVDDIEKRKAVLKAKQELNKLEREDEVTEDPCTLYDDDEWYTGFNQKEGRKGDAQLANTLLRLCQEQLRTKIKGRYQAVIRDYFDQMDMDGQSTGVSHIESAGDYIIDQLLNDTREECRKTSGVQDNGNIIMYMSIKVSKEELIGKLSEGLSKDKQEGVRIDERKFRESAFKIFEKNSPSKSNIEE